MPAGLKVELFAAEPLLANPVAFCIDEQGRFYVAKTFRLGAGVTDTRRHMDWLDDDLACRTVADRVAMYRKFLGKGFEEYKVEHERVRQIVDRDRDGKADSATVFADRFNDPAAGIGAGLLARKGEVWYGCIPWLWKLCDITGTGKITEPLLADEDPESRAQIARVLGEANELAALSCLIKLLGDPEPRVRFFAAVILGKLGREEASQPLLALLRANHDQDPYLRDAGVMGLAGLDDAGVLRQSISRSLAGCPHGRLARLAAARRSRGCRPPGRSRAQACPGSRAGYQRRSHRRGNAAAGGDSDRHQHPPALASARGQRQFPSGTRPGRTVACRDCGASRPF